MNWKPFWKAVDRFGEQGAPRCEWRWALGDAFVTFESMLKAGRALAESIHDPDDATMAMDIFESSADCFEAHSVEIPPHRKPFIVPRAELVMLTVNLPEVATALAPEIGLVPGEFRSRGHAGLHELGVISVANQAPQPVSLLLPGNRPRAIQLIETISKLNDAVVLLPSARGVDEMTRRMAAEHNVTLRSLELDPSRVLGALKPGDERSNKGIKPVFLPHPAWRWTMLELDFSIERFVATIAGQKFQGRWSQHGVRMVHHDEFTDFTQMLILLARKERIEQSRKDPALRKRVSRFRETLRRLFPLEGEPISGGNAQFLVSSKLTERRAKLLG